MKKGLLIVEQASSEALADLFEPAYSEGLNCTLAEHLLRMLAYRHLSKNGDKSEHVLRAITGPDQCRHGRSTMGTCAECSQEQGEFDEENSIESVLRAFCKAFKENRPFDRKRLFHALSAMGYARPEFDEDHDPHTFCAACEHAYERHFDSHEDNRPVGCKYCGCPTFVEPVKPVEKAP